MSYVTTGSFTPAGFPIIGLWRRFRNAFAYTGDTRAAALRRAQREGMPPHLMLDIGLIDTRASKLHLATMPPGRLHDPYF